VKDQCGHLFLYLSLLAPLLATPSRVVCSWEEAEGEPMPNSISTGTKAAIYARTAVQCQDQLEKQIKLCREVAELKGWVIPPEYVCSDFGASAAIHTNRPACFWQLGLAHFGSLIWPTPGTLKVKRKVLRSAGAKPVGRSGSRTQRRLLRGSLFSFLPQCSAKAIRLRAGLDDVSLIGQPVEHSLAEPCIGKDLRPFGLAKSS
jgi:hypothetical protein